jgi:hypothetical protein
MMISPLVKLKHRPSCLPTPAFLSSYFIFIKQEPKKERAEMNPIHTMQHAATFFYS